MKKIIRKIKKIDLKINAKKMELREAEISTYYIVFAPEQKRQEDIQDINIDIKALLSSKYAALETLQIEIEKAKAAISCQERSLTLKLNS